MGGPFFKIAHQELWEKAGIKTIISYPELEADDCIALTVERIKETVPDANIYIIANDMDYLQLACNNVFIYNLKYKNLCDSKNCTKDAECDKFCKIVCGDKSDNIPGIFKKCGIKTAIKYYNDQTLFNSKLKENNNSEKQFLLNKKLIDFNEIPINLKSGFKKDVLLI
jgi:5'-3' exonuclease